MAGAGNWIAPPPYRHESIPGKFLLCGMAAGSLPWRKTIPVLAGIWILSGKPAPPDLRRSLIFPPKTKIVLLSPPQVLPAPVQLRVDQTHFSGEGRASWRVVTNSRCYEVQSLPLTDASRPALQESSTAGVSPRANHTFKELPSGSFVSIRLRAVGAK